MDPRELMVWDGQGPVQIGVYDETRGTADQGFLVDLYRVGCATSSLTTALDVQKTRIPETCTGQRLTLKNRTTGRSLNVSLALRQFSGRTLAAALLGSAVGVAAGTVTAELLPELAPGDLFTLRHPDVSSVVVRDSTGTPVEYVLDTHYVAEDVKHARFRLVEHPASHTEPLRVDYAYGAYTNIAAFRSQTVQRGIIFNGRNEDGQRARIIIPRIDLTLSGDFGWIADEEATLSLSGEAQFAQALESDPLYGGFMRVDLI